MHTGHFPSNGLVTKEPIVNEMTLHPYTESEPTHSNPRMHANTDNVFRRQEPPGGDTRRQRGANSALQISRESGRGDANVPTSIPLAKMLYSGRQ